MQDYVQGEVKEWAEEKAQREDALETLASKIKSIEDCECQYKETTQENDKDDHDEAKTKVSNESVISDVEQKETSLSFEFSPIPMKTL